MASTDPWDAAVHLAPGLGLRRDEVLGFRWSDVDHGVYVHVHRTLASADGEIHFGPPKSAAGRRDIPVPDVVPRALQGHRLAQGERSLSLGLPAPSSSSPTRSGEPFRPASFSNAWRHFAEANGSTASDTAPRPWEPASRTRWPSGREAMPICGSWAGIRMS